MRCKNSFVIPLFSFIWRNRLIENGEKLQVVFVSGFRSAAVKGRMRSQETRTFLIKFFKWYV